MPTSRSTAKDYRRTQLLSTSENDISTFAYGLIDPSTKKLVRHVNRQGGVKATINERFADYDANDSVSFILPSGAARPTTTAVVSHMYTPGGNVYGVASIGTQTLTPVMTAAGLDISSDQVDTEGVEIFSNFAGATGSPFVVGYDPAFFFRVSLTCADASGAAVLIAGFRRAEVNNVTYTSYSDYAAIGLIAGGVAAGAINIVYENDASGSPTNTTDTWADTETKVFEIKVSGAGVITYKNNGAAPTTTLAGTFDDGDPVIPFVHLVQHGDLSGAVTINSWEVGYQS